MKLTANIVQRAGQEVVANDGMSKRVYLKDLVYLELDNTAWGPRMEVASGDREHILEVLHKLAGDVQFAIGIISAMSP